MYAVYSEQYMLNLIYRAKQSLKSRNFQHTVRNGQKTLMNSAMKAQCRKENGNQYKSFT